MSLEYWQLYAWMCCIYNSSAVVLEQGLPNFFTQLPPALTTFIYIGTTNVHDTDCSHPSCRWREDVAGLKLISCNYTHFVMGCRYFFFSLTANCLAILYFFPMSDVYSCDIWVTQALQQNLWAEKPLADMGLLIWIFLTSYKLISKYAMTDIREKQMMHYNISKVHLVHSTITTFRF
jgi:hypothetical protein